MCINQSPISAFIAGGGGGGSIATGVLQTFGGGAITATLQQITDQSNNTTPLYLATNKVSNVFAGAATGNIVWQANSTLTEYTGWHQSDGDYRIITKNASPMFINISAGLNFANGLSTQGGFNSSGFYVGSSVTQNGAATIKGSGGNILSLRNSGNVETAYLSNGGLFYTLNFEANNGGVFRWQGRSSLASSANGVITLYNNALSAFTRLNFGGDAASNPAISVSGGELHTTYADGTTGFCGFASGEGTKKGISVVKGATNTPYLGFYGVDEIAQPTTAIAEASFVSGGAGSNIKTDDLFGGYTLQQIAQALLELGFLS